MPVTEPEYLSSIATHLSEVVEVSHILPGLKRIVFAGGLEEFQSLGGDQFMYLLLPPLHHPDRLVGRDFTWDANNRLPADEQAEGAYYSIRAWTPGIGASPSPTIEMWFVLHGDGRAATWAAAARPGSKAALWGPRRMFEPPADTDQFLLITDETGYGATSALLEELAPRSEPVRVVAIAETPELTIDVPRSANVQIDWIFRQSAASGLTGALLDTLRAMPLSSRVYAYGAGESHQLSAVRRYLRDRCALPGERVSMVAYWRAERQREAAE